MSLMPEPTEFAVLQWITVVASGLTILTTGAVIVVFVLKRKSANFNEANRVLLVMSIVDLISGIAHAISQEGPKNNQLCTVQGVLIQATDLASTFWTAAVAFNLFLVIRYRKSSAELKDYEKYYHVTCTAIPALVAVTLCLPALQYRDDVPIYGNAGLWCSLASGHYDALRLYVKYIPLWLAFGAIAWIFVGIWRILGRAQENGKAIARQEDIRRVRRRYIIKSCCYFLVFVICWLPATINRVLPLIYGDSFHQHPFFLQVLHALFVPLYGCLKSTIFFWSGVCGTRAKRQVFWRKGPRIKAIDNSSLIDLTSLTNSQVVGVSMHLNRSFISSLDSVIGGGGGGGGERVTPNRLQIPLPPLTLANYIDGVSEDGLSSSSCRTFRTVSAEVRMGQDEAGVQRDQLFSDTSMVTAEPGEPDLGASWIRV